MGENAWIQFEFAEPQTIRAVTIASKDVESICRYDGRDRQPGESLEASDDGQTFRKS